MKFTEEQLNKVREFIEELEEIDNKEIIKEIIGRELNDEEKARIDNLCQIVFPYQCPICKRKFSNGRWLRGHLQKYLKEYDLSKYKNNKIWNLFLELVGKKYYCKKCGKELHIHRCNKYVSGYHLSIVSLYCNSCSNNLDYIKNKREQTCIDRYGVDNPLKSEKIKERIRKILISRYDVDNPSKSYIIKEKKKQTCLKNLGVDNPSKAEVVKEKKRQTCLKNLGVDNPFKSKKVKEKIIQTNIKNLGVDNPFKSKKIKEKIKQTWIKNWGVDHPMKNQEIKEKAIKNLFANSGVTKYYKGIPYQSDYELDFLHLCEKLNMICEVYKPPSFRYKDSEGNMHTYYPDFQINDVIIEIKSSYWLSKWNDIDARIKSVRDNGYKFCLIVDKNYNDFYNLITQQNIL